MSLKYEPTSEPLHIATALSSRFWNDNYYTFGAYYLRILVYLVIYDSGKVSLEHFLLSRYPSQSEALV